MKSLARSSVVSWLLLVGSATFLAPLALGQTEKPPQRDPGVSDPPCPTISVSCPEIVDYSKPLTFTGNLSVHPGNVYKYNWSVSAGTIVEGQGTPTIKVNIEGTSGEAYTATLWISGLNPTCPATASCSLLPGIPAPPAVLFDRYYPTSAVRAVPKKQRARRRATRRP